MSHFLKRYNAFTLIEILVVVGLIAILAAITIVALNPTKMFARSRNVERWNEIRAIQSALEQWIVDGNDVTSLTEGDGSNIGICGEAVTLIMDQPTVSDQQVDLDALLVEEYLAEIPRDPTDASGSNTGYKMCMFSNPVRYLIYAPSAELSEVIEIPVTGEVAVLTDGLDAYWKMNEASWNGTADEVTDSSISGNHGTAVGNTTTTSGLFGNSGTFDASGDYIQLGDQSAFDLTLPFTISLWMNLDQLPSTLGRDVSLITKYSPAPSRQWIIEIGSNDDLYFWKSHNGTNGQYVVHNYVVDASDVGTWRHVVVTADSNGLTNLYVDANLIDSNSMVETTMANTTAPLQIGRRNSSPYYYFDGLIDDVRLYSRELDSGEVDILFNHTPD